MSISATTPKLASTNPAPDGTPAGPRPSRPAVAIACGSFLLLGLAGLLLWWREGQDVFVQAITSAIAGCF